MIAPPAGVDEPARQRRDPGEALQEIERRPFGGQHRRGRAAHFARRRRRACSARRRAAETVNAAAGIELPERLAATSSPAITQADLARMTPRARRSTVDRRFGRDVAPAEIFGQRAADGLAIERGIERLERHRLHRARSPATSRRLRARRPPAALRPLRLEPLDQPGRAQIGFDRRQERQHRRRRADDGHAVTGVFSGRCSSDFFLRIAPSTVGGQARSASTPRRRRSTPAQAGEHLLGGRPRARVWIEPSLPPRPDFFGHERQERREQPQQHRQRGEQRGVGRRRARRVPDRRSGGPSRARGSRRRSTRRTSRCARSTRA